MPGGNRAFGGRNEVVRHGKAAGQEPVEQVADDLPWGRDVAGWWDNQEDH